MLKNWKCWIAAGNWRTTFRSHVRSNRSRRMRASERFSRQMLAIALVLLCWPQNAAGYSVLTHQELIDLAWNDSIRPLLLKRFPGATDAQLREAHAYAYGGCAIQDMGYYPFGKEFFSNLTHYVRSG